MDFRMNRRTLLKRLAAMPLAPALGSLLPATLQTALPTKSSFRRVRPSDPSWPSKASWEKLKQQVSGRLIPVQSLLAACQSGPDTMSCRDVLKNLQNPYFIGDRPGGTQTTGWVDGWISSPSVYAVAAQNTTDVVHAVNFARENHLRLVVKGGGHSYQGTSSAPDSLLVWTRAMHNITLHDTFVPRGARANKRRSRP
jgi:FAD binding domain